MTLLFVTAQTSPDIEVAALNAGGSDFIHKPLVPELVRARIRLHAQLQEQREMLRTLAFADGLTGLWNRRKFDETLATEWRWSRRQSGALSVLMLDVDHFKQYNDRYGHLDGDRCLKSVAGAIRHCAGRPHDLVARYGGEEFAFILPDASLSAALAIAEKARMAVAGLEMPHDVSPVASHVTVSIGVASMLPSDDIASDMLRRADQALYAAKQRGRNQVCANGP